MSKSTTITNPLTFSDYAEKASRTDRFAQTADSLRNLKFGFFGEVGGLLSALKKVSRDSLQASEAELAGEELGDALWYLAAVAKRLGLQSGAVAVAAMREMRTRFNEADAEAHDALELRQLDAMAALHCQQIKRDRQILLSELALQGGVLLSSSESIQHELGAPSDEQLMGKLLALLVLIAASYELDLEQVACQNLEKNERRWPSSTRVYTAHFDEAYPGYEQFPRRFEIKFQERDSGHVVQSMNGVCIGDRLTDNNTEADDYRFHDVFHLAYVAHLGWSPVLRALLKLKRKSNATVDETQDGARAMIIEEGIATWIFNHAKHRNFYADIKDGTLDYGLLKQVQSMVEGYEVERCPPWQWESAILEGFRIFREMKKPEHRGGVVSVDMDEHRIEFHPLDKQHEREGFHQAAGGDQFP